MTNPFVKTIFCLTFLFALHFKLFSAPTIYEAENAVLAGGLVISKNVSGYSGSGYVTNSTKIGDAVTFTVNVATAGKYKLVSSYRSEYGNKTQDLLVNGVLVTPVTFPTSTVFTSIYLSNVSLNQGNNTLTIRHNWGYMDLDNIGIEPFAPNVYNLAPNLVNPNANAKTKALYELLKDNFGTCIFTGQTDYWDQLLAITGKSPAVRGFDMQNYSPQNPWCNSGTMFCGYDDGTITSAINWYNATNGKGIVTFHWHWFSPSGGSLRTSTFYSDRTSFDASRAIVSSTQEYKDVMRDIDAIAVQLKRLQTAGVPVLWRPLHEAGGTWFWWGAKGANVAKTLYYMMYDRLTNYHQLNNLIWVWSSPEPDWYPGNDKVDMIGYDSYPGAYNYSSQKAVFNQLYSIVNGEKLIALTETGPIPNINQSLADDVPWLYFLAWNDLVASQNSTAHIQEVYNQGCNLSSLLTGTYEEENSFKTEFKIYPNPFTKSAIVELKSLETLPLQLSISNANGQLVYITDKHFTNEKIILPAELPLGMLWLKVSYGNNYANVFKMVKTE